MKRFILICSIVASTLLAMYAFRTKFQTSIVGSVNPVEGANTVWAVSGRDSTACNVVDGTFSFGAKQGIYKVVIDGVEPYKDAVLENISVKDGQTVDVGEIDLHR